MIEQTVYVSVVYNKVEGGNRLQSERIINELKEISNELSEERWVVMGDFNAHIGLMTEEMNVNR